MGITAGEAKNPQVTLKRAINNILWRILIFYVGAIFVIVTIFPWNGIGTTGSPFVLTFAKIGIVAAAGIINFVVLTAALSGCNSGMYSGGRMLYALAKNRQLPAALTAFRQRRAGELHRRHHRLPVGGFRAELHHPESGAGVRLCLQRERAAGHGAVVRGADKPALFPPRS